jgi:ABC-2 type transport system ATP-binding protein
MSTPLIEIDALAKRYGTKVALDGLSLRVEGGTLFGFLGPNGAGKTTTIHTLMGLKNPTAGDVRINGVSVRSPAIREVRRRIGYLPEQPVLYDNLTGREFLRFVAELHGDPGAAARVEPLLERLGLGPEAGTLLRTLSMGTRKKVALLAALVHDPDILVLDEPTGALDAASARVVKDVMQEAAAAGKLVFFTTHVMEIAERFAHRLAILHRGALVAEGTLAELRQRFGRRPGETLEELFLRLTGGDARGAQLKEGTR